MTNIEKMAHELIEKISDQCDSANCGGTFDDEKASEIIKSSLQSYGDQKLEEAAECCDNHTEYGDMFAKQIRALKSPSGEKS